MLENVNVFNPGFTHLRAFFEMHGKRIQNAAAYCMMPTRITSEIHVSHCFQHNAASTVGQNYKILATTQNKIIDLKKW